ncbi:unnamed protein product, partial [Nesidiocoris tenuis]
MICDHKNGFKLSGFNVIKNIQARRTKQIPERWCPEIRRVVNVRLLVIFLACCVNDTRESNSAIHWDLGFVPIVNMGKQRIFTW